MMLLEARARVINMRRLMFGVDLEKIVRVILAQGPC